jgi:hypothetical protein
MMMMVVMMVMVFAMIVIAMVVMFHRHGIGCRRLDQHDEGRQGEGGRQKRRGEKFHKHHVSFQIEFFVRSRVPRLDNERIGAKLGSLVGVSAGCGGKSPARLQAAGAVPSADLIASSRSSSK